MDKGMALAIALDSIKERIETVERRSKVVLADDHPWREARRVLRAELDAIHAAEDAAAPF